MHPLRYENTYLNLLDDYVLDNIYEHVLKPDRIKHQRKFKRVRNQLRQIFKNYRHWDYSFDYIKYLLDVSLLQKGYHLKDGYFKPTRVVIVKNNTVIWIYTISLIDKSNQCHNFIFINNPEIKGFDNEIRVVIIHLKRTLILINQGYNNYDELREKYDIEYKIYDPMNYLFTSKPIFID